MADMTRLLLLLLAGVSVSSAVSLEKRMYGGEKCKESERQYHVQLVDKNGVFYCGGSLIHKQWILTAAHCWKKGMKAVLNVHGSASPTTVPIPGPPVKNKQEGKIHDIMLLKLQDHQVPVTTIELPPCGSLVPRQVQIAGHAGSTEPSTHLQCADIDIIDCKDFQNTLKNEYKEFYDSSKDQSWFCAKTTGKGIHEGDSGGGVVFQDMLYGVISFFSGEEFQDLVGIMEVCLYKDWIKGKLAKDVAGAGAVPVASGSKAG